MKKLTEKLLDIISEIPSLSKEGTNQEGRYNYITESSVLKIVKPILIKHKVLVTSEVTEVEIENAITTAYLRHTFIDAETGEEKVFLNFGTGYDLQDKGVYKAFTGGLKYFLIKNLLIETDENLDPEYDGLKKKAKEGTPYQPGTQQEEEKRQTLRERKQEHIAKLPKTDLSDNLKF